MLSITSEVILAPANADPPVQNRRVTPPNDTDPPVQNGRVGVVELGQTVAAGSGVGVAGGDAGGASSPMLTSRCLEM